MDFNFNGLSNSLKNIDVNGKANDLLMFFSSLANLLDCFNSLKRELNKDEKGEIVSSDKDASVPKTLSPKERGYGDYIIMDIDENGQIANWKFDFSDFDDSE